ncbi:hypothetical protein DIPPA_29551 [Diplonema papillatum]|nr:hypothetical protein DIPPA_29551 [Diplonema papillatum]
MARDAVRQRILNMYAFYNPSKLAVVKDMLRDAAGHEGDVLQTLVQKYGPEPSPDAFALSHRERLVRFYERYNPSKLKNVDQLLRQYKGKEEELFSTLVRRYGEEPAAAVSSVSPGGRFVESNDRLKRTRQLCGLRSIAGVAQLLLRQQAWRRLSRFARRARRRRRRQSPARRRHSEPPGSRHAADEYLKQLLHRPQAQYADLAASNSRACSETVIVVHHHHGNGKPSTPPRVHVHDISELYTGTDMPIPIPMPPRVVAAADAGEYLGSLASTEAPDPDEIRVAAFDAGPPCMFALSGSESDPERRRRRRKKKRAKARRIRSSEKQEIVRGVVSALHSQLAVYPYPPYPPPLTHSLYAGY